MSTKIPRGNIDKLFAVSITADVSSRTANTTTEFDMTVPGVKVNDIVVCCVKSADTIATTWVNATGSGVDPASQTYIFVIARPETPGGLPAIFNA
jgi:hypothetical protein